MKACFYDYLHLWQYREKEIETEILGPVREAGFEVDYKDPSDLEEEPNPYDCLLVHPSIGALRCTPASWLEILFEETQKPILILSGTEEKGSEIRKIIGYRGNLHYSDTIHPDVIISFLEKCST